MHECSKLYNVFDLYVRAHFPANVTLASKLS